MVPWAVFNNTMLPEVRQNCRIYCNIYQLRTFTPIQSICVQNMVIIRACWPKYPYLKWSFKISTIRNAQNLLAQHFFLIRPTPLTHDNTVLVIFKDINFLVCEPYKACCWLWNVIAKLAGYILIVCIHTPVDDCGQIIPSRENRRLGSAFCCRAYTPVEKMLFITLQDMLYVSWLKDIEEAQMNEPSKLWVLLPMVGQDAIGDMPQDTST